MKVMSLYSDVDYFILAVIAIITAVIFLNWLGKKIKSQKKRSINLSEDDDFQIDLSHYALSFESVTVAPKTIGLGSKLVLFMFALVIVVIPLSEFVGTLKPQWVFEGFSCLVDLRY
jgi:uncharacterized ion transporter superfamily protein YfcC